MNIGTICSRPAHTVERGDRVEFAAQAMVAHDVGALIVTDKDNVPEGIVTDRDIVVRGVAIGLRGDVGTVADVMSARVHALDEDTPMETAVEVMAQAGIRRMAVTGRDGRLVGVLSLDDLLGRLVEETDEIGKLLRVQVGV